MELKDLKRKIPSNCCQSQQIHGINRVRTENFTRPILMTQIHGIDIILPGNKYVFFSSKYKRETVIIGKIYRISRQTDVNDTNPRNQYNYYGKHTFI